MKKVVLGLLLLLTQFVFAQVQVGDKAPLFNLKNVDGEFVRTEDFNGQKGIVLVFTCNHCPYAKAYEDRIIALQNKYDKEFPVVAINPNDAKEYPDDSFENMIVRSKEKNFNFPYLYDQTQEVARAYGVAKTPQVYVLSNGKEGLRVAYIGAIDNNYVSAKKAKKKYVENAVDALLAGEKVNPTTTAAVGCSIKWKK